MLSNWDACSTVFNSWDNQKSLGFKGRQVRKRLEFHVWSRNGVRSGMSIMCAGLPRNAVENFSMSNCLVFRIELRHGCVREHLSRTCLSRFVLRRVIMMHNSKDFKNSQNCLDFALHLSCCRIYAAYWQYFSHAVLKLSMHSYYEEICNLTAGISIDEYHSKIWLGLTEFGCHGKVLRNPFSCLFQD